MKLTDFINLFDFWNDGDSPDPTGSSSYPSAAYYMPQSAAEQQGLVWVNSENYFGIIVQHIFYFFLLNVSKGCRLIQRMSTVVLTFVHPFESHPKRPSNTAF